MSLKCMKFIFAGIYFNVDLEKKDLSVFKKKCISGLTSVINCHLFQSGSDK